MSRKRKAEKQDVTRVELKRLGIHPTGAVYSELSKAYNFFNRRLFDGELPVCVITLQREKSSMGYFSRCRFVRHTGEKAHEIAMNPSYFASISKTEIMQTLVHEMVHLWQAEFGSPGRNRYHNKEWAQKMQSVGLMPSDTSAPGGRKTGDRMGDYVIEGGVFDSACQKLLTELPELISWLDRVAVYVRPPQDPRQLLALEMSDGEEPDPLRLQEAEQQYLKNLEEYQELVQQQGALEIGHIVRPEATKARFTCPNCGTKVWGKFGLKVFCGNCGPAPVLMKEG